MDIYEVQRQTIDRLQQEKQQQDEMIRASYQTIDELRSKIRELKSENRLLRNFNDTLQKSYDNAINIKFRYLDLKDRMEKAHNEQAEKEI